MAHNFKSGDLLICVDSAAGNAGRIVKVIDETFDRDAPEYKDCLCSESTDMVVECMSDVPLRFMLEGDDGVEPTIVEGWAAAVSSKNYRLLCYRTDLTAV